MPAERHQTGIHVVRPARRSRPRGKVASSVFTHGDAVPETAIYAVAHAHHAVPLQVTLRSGSLFPSCSRCDEPVEFRFLRSADVDGADRFQVTLNVLPVLDEDAEQELAPPRRLALAG